MIRSNRHSRERPPPSKPGSAATEIHLHDFGSLDAGRLMTPQTVHLYIRNIFGPGKTDSELEFLDSLYETGAFSLRLVIIFICTMWYISIGFIHKYTVLANDILSVRCEIPELEKHFNFSEILDISYKRKDQRTIMNKQIVNEYCKYDARNYTALAAAHNYNYESIMKTILEETTDPKEVPCQSYVILKHHSNSGRSVGTRSIKGEFHFYCKDDIWNKALYILPQYGSGIANIIGGIAADIYGRKKVFVITSIMHAAGFVIFAIPWKWCLILGDLLIGCGSIAAGILYIMFLEICDKTTLLWLGLLISFFTPIASFVCFALHPHITNWRYVHLANTSMLLVLPFIICYITESPRWLMFAGDKQNAWKTLQECGGTDSVESSLLSLNEVRKPTFQNIIRQAFQPLFRERIITCLILHCIEAISMYVETIELTGEQEFHTNEFFLISASMQFLIISIVSVSAIQFGRRRTIFIMYCVLSFHDGIMFMLNQYLRNMGLNVISVLLDFHLAMSQTIVHTLKFYVAEMFPTPIRLTAVGITRASYHFGSVLQQHLYIVFHPRESTLTYMPLFVASISCALLIGFLPKTQNTGLPDALRDALYLKISQ